MNSTTPPASERQRRSFFYQSSDGPKPIYGSRMYHFQKHGGMTLHTHFGRYSNPYNNRVLWVSMTIADLIFTDIPRSQAASALWAYRHDSSLTITQLNPGMENQS